MYRKSAVSVASQKPQIFGRKKIRFNEQSIRATLYALRKDYGFKGLTESKTPYPRYDEPIAAEELRKRLQRYIDEANKNMPNAFGVDNVRHNVSRTRTPAGSLDYENEELGHIEFNRKRKLFNQAEFIIAQQKSMSLEMPEPGPSIGNNGHIENVNVNSLELPSPLESFITNSSVLQGESNANYEALLEIARQISQQKTT